MEIDKIDKTGESMKTYLPAFLWITFNTTIVQALSIPHFKGLNMRNLQYEKIIFPKHDTKVTITMSIECQFFSISR